MKTVACKIHLSSRVEAVFELLTTSAGQERFWVETADENNGVIHFTFPNGQSYRSRIINSVKNIEFQLDYFNSDVTFKLETGDNGGTDLILINKGVRDEEFAEVRSGWVSVLLNLKAVAEFSVDLRNHHPNRSWDQGYVDN